MSIERIQPEGLRESAPRYTQVVRASGGATVYISGQIALDKDGQVVGEGDFAVQARQVFENLRIALEAAGATFHDVVKMTSFVVNLDQGKRELLSAARVEAMGDAQPASTLLGVQALAAPEYLLEVEMTAVVGS
jgi:enamine deaminase RidA (YjgF/YER057c/UK114 family)